jgi:hypothetical protein
MHYQNRQHGAILIYVLLVISLITAIAITVSFIIVNELKLTASAADATMAYYAAESGIEKGLYGVKVFRNNNTPFYNNDATINSTLEYIRAYHDTGFSNAASYTNDQTTSVSSSIINREIKKDGYAQADYYEIDDPLGQTLPNTTVRSLLIQNNGANLGSWAEVSWTAWNNQGTLGASIKAKVIIGATNLQNGWVINDLSVFQNVFQNGILVPFVPTGYRLRIRALFGDLSSLTVTPYDQPDGPSGGGNIVTDLPAQLAITSIGKRNTFKQALTATVPWKLPLSGLYDYVLFSEGEISKTTILSQPIYSSGVIQVEAAINSGDACKYDRCNECSSYLGGPLGWSGLACYSSDPDPQNSPVLCTGSKASGPDGQPAGICELAAYHTGYELWGWQLPIPNSIPAGGEYYVSIRTQYANGNCDGNNYCGRKIAVEISGQSSVVDDQAAAGDKEWHTCTIPEAFSVSDVSDPSGRNIKFTIEPFGGPENPKDVWNKDETVYIDWYQLSTYKIYPDCP